VSSTPMTTMPPSVLFDIAIIALITLAANGLSVPGPGPLNSMPRCSRPRAKAVSSSAGHIKSRESPEEPLNSV